MNKEKISQYLAQSADAQEWTHETRLWPRIAARLPEDRRGFANPGLNRALTAAALGFIALVLFVAITPAGKALAQEVLGFFNKAPQPVQQAPVQALVPLEPSAISTIAPLPAAQPAGCGTIFDPRCSVPEVEDKLGFQLLSFEPLPEGLSFAGATFQEDTAILIYRADGGSLILQESPRDDQTLKPWLVGEDASIHQVNVGNLPAEYVQGAWWPSEDGQVWEADARQHSLRWETDDLRLSLTAAAGKVYEPLQISRDELILLAATLTQVESWPPHPETARSIQELSAAHGFALRLPQDLPQGFYLSKTQYEPATGAVCAYYNWGPTDDKAFFIAQMPGALPAALFADMHTMIDGQSLSRAVSTVDWQLPGAAAKYFDNRAEGALLCPEPHYYVGHGLAWTKDGISYGIFGLGSYFDSYADFFITQADLRSFAAQINGEPLPEPGFDPERFYSPKEAEALIGKPMPMPSRMLADFNFAYMGKEEDPTLPEPRALKLRTVFLGPVSGYEQISSLQIEQVAASEELSLAEIEGWGGFEPATVWGEAALIRSICSPMAGLEGVNFCRLDLYWFNAGTMYSMRILGDREYDHAAVLQIAESMQP